MFSKEFVVLESLQLGEISVEERVAVLPSEDDGLVGFLELDRVDDVEFLDCEGVERVVGGVGSVIFEAARWDRGFGLDAVFGGAPCEIDDDEKVTMIDFP
ncbi:hypothetical protein FF1_043451 [Malus domestica]